MSTRFRLDFVAWAALVYGWNACAQEPSDEAFTNELLEPIEISSRTIWSERLTPLAPSQRESLLRAKDVLGEFFRSLDRIGSDPRQFMTDEYARRMGNKQSIHEAFVGYETTIEQIRVTDFSLLGEVHARREDALELSFYVMVFSTGTYVVGEGRATLRKIGEAWRVDDVVIFYP